MFLINMFKDKGDILLSRGGLYQEKSNESKIFNIGAWGHLGMGLPANDAYRS